MAETDRIVQEREKGKPETNQGLIDDEDDDVPEGALGSKVSKDNHIAEWNKAQLTEAEIQVRDETSGKLEPTDVFGTIRYQGKDCHYQNLIEYVRMDKDTNMDNLLDFLKKDWGLQRPKLLMSVTGGAKDFNCFHQEEYCQDIVEAAIETDAWIVTGGTNGGVSKHIGIAVGNNRHSESSAANIVLIGITAWNRIKKETQNILKISSDKKKMRYTGYSMPNFYRNSSKDGKQKLDDSSDLEPNHTHFLLVDAGPETPADDIQLRGKLESAISKDWDEDDTMVLVVCIVIEGDEKTIETVSEAVKNGTPVVVIADTGGAADILSQAFNVFKLNNELTITDEHLKSLVEDEDKIAKAAEQINSCFEYPHLLHVYERDSPVDINQAIFDALKTAKSNPKDQLMLAMKWNRADVESSLVKLEPEGRSEALRYALVNNKPEFVKMLLRKEDIKKYLTDEELQDLYTNAQMPDPLSKVLRTVHIQNPLTKVLRKKGYEKLEDIDELIRVLTDGAINIRHKTMNKDEKGCFQRLFIYAVLHGFDEMAFYFWTMGRDSMPAALVASKLYKSMATLKFNTDWKQQMLANASKYEKYACGILDLCKGKPRMCFPSDLLIRILPNWGNVTCLDLAESAEDLEFLSHSIVTTFLHDIWYGDIHDSFGDGPLEIFKSLLCSCLPFLIPFVVKFKKSNSAWEKIQKFYSSPQTVFRHSMISYILFLVLFSNNLLWEDISISSESASWSDWLLFFWVFSITTEEIREMTEREANHDFVDRMKGWWSNHWNKLDGIALSLFVAGTALRFNSQYEDSARMLLAFNLFIYYIRFLEYLTFVKSIGPKVLMIGRMFIDLLFFMCILFIILLGYGISTQVILYPHVTSPGAVFESILYRSYFPIYGELFLDDLRASEADGSCTNNTTAIEQGATPCPAHAGFGVFLLAIYILISNVLLLNLLIAMFSNTFNNVEAITDQHWRFQRYSLTKEYVQKPIFVPPLSIISHTGHMILYLWFVAQNSREDYHKVFQQMRSSFGEEHPLVVWGENKATQFKKSMASKRLKTQTSLILDENESDI